MLAQSIETLWEDYHKEKRVDTRNKLIMQYSSLVKRIALKTIGNYQYFSQLDDIINEGIIALMDAIEKFDVSKNVKFETYASIKIKGAMIDFIRKQDCFPRRIKKISKLINEAESLLSVKLGRTPTNEEIARHIGMTNEEFDKAQLEVYALNVYSFVQMLYENSSETILENYFAIDKDTPEQRLDDKELRRVLAEGISVLKENEQLVIALHYKEQLKIKDIAGILKISDSRVSQIHSAALKKLKDRLDKYKREELF
ncbi:MAG: FliA/WhiG family RNA polymerase sigma factor [Oscillospiraceae bacterium]